MKKGLVILLIVMIFALSCFTGCGQGKNIKSDNIQAPEKIEIIATLFPQYDFAKQIAGNKANVTLLLTPGVESHSYEPTPSDIIKINHGDLFLYTGNNMEIWSQKIIDGMADSDTVILNVSEGIKLIKPKHQHEEESGHKEKTGHDHTYDPHVWTSPVNAQIMVSNIIEALCIKDPQNADYYMENAKQYIIELKNLDNEFRQIVKNGQRKEIVFGSRFALSYFVNEYGLSYEAAFDSCSSETEPSVKTMANLIEEIRSKKIPVIYYAELEAPKVAEAISEETGAKAMLFHSCHNVTKDEFQRGETYLSLMKQNAESLREGLK